MRYYSIEEYLKRLLNVAAFAACMEVGAVRSRILHGAGQYFDVIHGKLYDEKVQSYSDVKYLFPLILYHDSMRVTETPQASVTPVLAANGHIPLHARWKTASLMLLALLPRGTSKVQGLMEPVLQEAKKLSINGVTVSVRQSDGSLIREVVF